MKALKDLSKTELLSFLYNNHQINVNLFDELAECVICGTKSDAKYYYCCDSCNEALKKD